MCPGFAAPPERPHFNSGFRIERQSQDGLIRPGCRVQYVQFLENGIRLGYLFLGNVFCTLRSV